MSKRNKKVQKCCTNHVFQLKPLFNQSKLPDKTCISFCEHGKNLKESKTCQKNSSQLLSYPIYNSDHNHATPSFILQQDKCHFKEQGPRLKQQHDMKMGSYLDQKDSLNVPKPKTKTNHCNVCRQPYEDYLIHIQSQTHQQKTRNNIYTRYIEQLAHHFSTASMRNKNKTYHSSHHTLTTQGEDQKEIPSCLPKKKIKTQEDNSHRILQNNKNNLPFQYVGNQNNYEAQNTVNPEQNMQNTVNPNFWYNPYFYSIVYPFNYQVPYQNQLYAQPCYPWMNNPYFYNFNTNNLTNFPLNQAPFPGNQPFINAQNIPQVPLFNQNILSNQ